MISDLSTNPSVSYTWVLYYYDVGGVELTTDLFLGLEEDEIPWEITVIGNRGPFPAFGIIVEL